MSLAGLVGAVVVGLAYYFVTRWYDLFLIFPFGAGALVGIAVAFAVHPAKCRNVRVAFVVGLLAGVLTYGIKLSGDCYHLYYEEIPGLIAIRERISTDEARQLTSATVARRGYGQTFLRSLAIQAEMGVEVRQSGRYSNNSRSGSTVSGWGFYALLLIEVAILGITAGGFASAGVMERFCETCNQWYKEITLLRLPEETSPEIVQKLKNGDYAGVFAEPPADRKDRKNYCAVVLKSCPSCYTTGQLIVKHRVDGTTKQPLTAPLTSAQIAEIREYAKSRA